VKKETTSGYGGRQGKTEWKKKGGGKKNNKMQIIGLGWSGKNTFGWIKPKENEGPKQAKDQQFCIWFT